MRKPKIALKKWFAGFEETRNIACLIRAQKVYLEMEDPQALIEIYKKAIDPNQPQAAEVRNSIKMFRAQHEKATSPSSK